MKPRKCVFNIVRLSVFKNKFAALLGGAAFLFYSCVNDIETIKAFSSSELLPMVHAYNYETTFTDSGVVRFFMKTPELMRFENDGQAFDEFPKGLELVKYDNNRRIVSYITARYAKRYIREKRWEAKNEVVAVNAAGDTLKTDHLIWDEREARIYSDQYVRIVRPDQIITGFGFESDQSMDNWKIKNPRGTIYVQVNPESKAEQDSLVPGNRFANPMEIQP